MQYTESQNFKYGIIGCGWLGTPLGKQLAESGGNVFGTTTSSRRFSELRENQIHPVLLDLGNHPRKNEPVLPTADIIILLLTPGVVWPNRQQISQLIRQTQCRQLILGSATSVYPNTNGLVREDDAEYAVSPHSGIVLLSLEDHFRNMPKPAVAILRFAGLFGPNREPGRFFRKREKMGGGDNPVNLVHQEDCIRAIETVIENEPVTGTYNICADEHPTRKKFYTARSVKIGINPPEFTSESIPFKKVDNSLFKDTYGFTYSVHLE